MFDGPFVIILYYRRPLLVKRSLIFCFMLAKLFGSNARVKILKQFLFHPDEKYYIRQLARDLDLQVTSVSRELENLEKFGLLKAETDNSKGKGKADRKFYRTNQNFILFEDIKALVAKAQVLYKESFVEDLVKAGSIKLLVLTGVFVNNFSSPIDVLIVGKVNKDKLTEVISRLEKELGREINFTILSALEFKYRREITDVFLYDILGGEKIIIIDEIGLS